MWNKCAEGHALIANVENFYIRKLKINSLKHGGSMPPTRATVYCFFFLKSGIVKIEVADRKITISQGECLIIPSGQIFSVTSFEGEIDGYMGGFHSDFLAKSEITGNNLTYIYGWLSNPIPLVDNRLFYISNLFDRIYDEWTSENPDMSIIRSYIISFLLELNNLKSRSTGLSGGNGARFITENFMRLLSSSTSIDIGEYASLLGVTTGHLTKCVSKVTGKSTLKWIEEKVMMEAKMLLYQTNLSINEVARKVGIDDASYFSRAFKRKLGMTPSEFRKMIKKS